jgi:hypothetical protein
MPLRFQPCDFRQCIDMRNLPWSEEKINAKEGKQLYFQQMEAFCEAWAEK